MNELVPWEEKRGLARALVESKLFGLKDESQALGLMALCEAEGLHPAKAVQEFHIISGRPALKSDAMLARFQKAGGSVNWSTYTDDKVEGTFTHPQGGSVTVEWTTDRARKIGLTKNEVWAKYPRNMLRARCISEAVRAVYPGIATGIYTVEEMQTMPPQEVKDMGAIEQDIPPEPSQEMLDRAAEAAAKGLPAYESFWTALTTDERKLIGQSRHLDFKSMAEEVVG